MAVRAVPRTLRRVQYRESALGFKPSDPIGGRHPRFGTRQDREPLANSLQSELAFIAV